MYKEIYILLTNTQDYIFVIFVIGNDPQKFLFASATFLIVFFLLKYVFKNNYRDTRYMLIVWYELEFEESTTILLLGLGDFIDDSNLDG